MIINDLIILSIVEKDRSRRGKKLRRHYVLKTMFDHEKMEGRKRRRNRIRQKSLFRRMTNRRMGKIHEAI